MSHACFTFFKITDVYKQRINNIALCNIKLSKYFAETHKMMQNAYSFRPYFQCLGHTQFYNRFKRFQNGRMSVDDDLVQDVRRRQQTMLIRQKSMKFCALMELFN